VARSSMSSMPRRRPCESRMVAKTSISPASFARWRSPVERAWRRRQRRVVPWLSHHPFRRRAGTRRARAARQPLARGCRGPVGRGCRGRW
jgi:hypothetical protein